MSRLNQTNEAREGRGNLGRIDVHCHLLPGVDDGCESVAESLRCAREMVAAGYTHSFCTPHIWPHFTHNTVARIPENVRALQRALDEAGIPLQLLSGGEIGLLAGVTNTPPDQVVSYAMAGKYVLGDIWCDRLPAFFEPTIRWLQGLGLTVILAHPERMNAVQSDPALADYFADLGLLLQGNLQCFGDPAGSATRRIAEQYLTEGRYFMLGSDLHNLAGLPVRLRGLQNVIELSGEETARKLTIENPSRLLPKG